MVTTLLDQWIDVVDRWPGRVAVEDATGTRTFEEIWTRIQAVGSVLAARGLEVGDRIAILSSGLTRQYFEIEHGIMTAGFVRVPLDPSAPPSALVPQLRHSGAKAILHDRRFGDLAASMGFAPHLRFVLGDDAFEREVGRTAPHPIGTRSPDDVASLNFTGGTTGLPKAVTLTHRNLSSVVTSVNGARPLQDEDTLLNVRPMWPISGILVTIHALAGSRVVLGPAFEAATFTQRVQQHGATHTSVVPTMLVRLLNNVGGTFESLRSLRSIDIGAAGVDHQRMREAVERIGPRFGAVYGLTEAPWTCYRPTDDLLAEDGSIVPSVGRPVGDHRVSIIDAVERREKGGEVGEIAISGDHVMVGYWRDEAGTSEVMAGSTFRTGDLGKIDEAGRLQVVGRIKEIIRTGGRSVEPREVESVIAALAGVQDVAVVGMPDEEWGERVVAAVVPANTTIHPADVEEACRNVLASFKKPREVVFVQSIPRSHYGKVLSVELKSILKAFRTE